MPGIIDQIKKVFFEKAKPLNPGMYSYNAPAGSEFPYRLHLRIDANGDGILILNASTVLHLNQTATEFAYHFIKQTPQDQILESIINRYQIPYYDALRDYESFFDRLNTLIQVPDLDPVTYLGLDRQSPFSKELSAPYRLDCALTYTLTSGDGSGEAPLKRVDRELSTQEWKEILQKAWDAGIPHVVFTGGEPTTRNDLIELSQFSQDLGQVTGLITDGEKLQDPLYLDQLLISGLDHIQIVLDPDKQDIWEGIKQTLVEDIHLTVHLTVSNENQDQIPEILNKLVELGLQNISLSCNEINLLEKTKTLRDYCAEIGLNLVWNLPVPYSKFNPFSAEVEGSENTSNGAGLGWLYVEPDGDVLPTQGINVVLGNFLKNTWDEIWTKARQNRVEIAD